MQEIPQYETPEIGAYEYEDDAELPSTVDSLGSALQDRFQEYKLQREDIEDDWLEDLRAFNGEYSNDVQKALQENPNRSRVFVGLTRTKVMSAYSRLVDLMFQPNDNFWTITPTPVPTLDLEKEMAIKKKATQEIVQIANGDMVVANQLMPELTERMDELKDEVRAEINESAERAAEKMTEVIEDYMVEQNVEGEVKSLLLEMCLFGSGVMKGAVMHIKRQERWGQTENGWTHMTEETPCPHSEFVSIFDFYPDPYATSIKDCQGVFQRHTLTRQQLRDLHRDNPRFSQDVIETLISTYETGNHTLLEHEIERRRLAGIDTDPESGRFEVLEYWGVIDGDMLEQAGVQMENPTMEHYAQVWVCEGRVLMARLNPYNSVQQIPYQAVPFERVPHRFWGVGIARMMRDSQETLNAAVRMYIDNSALASTPQVEVNLDLLTEGEDPTDLAPWKTWLRSGGDPSQPLLRFYQPNAVGQGLATLIDMMRRFADEETSLPSYTHGQQSQGLNKTAAGMSMLFSAANTVLKSVVKNIDDFLTSPLLTSYYNFIMQFGYDDSVKGDMQVYARGSSALIAKEIRSQRLMQFLQMTTNQVDMNLVDRRELLSQIAGSLDLEADKVLIDEQQLEQQQLAGLQEALLQQQQANGGMGPQAPQLGAEPAMGGNGSIPPELLGGGAGPAGTDGAVSGPESAGPM